MPALLLYFLALTEAHAGLTAAAAPPAAATWPAAIIGALRDPPTWRRMDSIGLPAFYSLATLDYGKPVNVTRLEPLIARLELAAEHWPMTPQAFAELPPERKAQLLYEAANAAREDANARADKVLVKLRYGNAPESRLRALYEEAERILLLETPYLGRGNRAELEQALPPLIRRIHAYEEGAASRRVLKVERELEVQAPAYRPQNDSEGGLMEAPPPQEGARWDDEAGYDGFLTEGDGKLSGYTPLMGEQIAAHARRNRDANGLYRYDLPAFKRVAPEAYDAESPDFPLDAAKDAYWADLHRAARERRSSRFWRLGAKTYARLESFVSAHLKLFRSVGRIGPAGKNTLERLRSQTEQLYTLLDAMALERGLSRSYGLFGRNNPLTWRTRITDAIEKLRSDLQKAGDARDQRAQDAYARAEKARELKKPARLVRQLLKLDRYYRWRWNAAERDPDPAHRKDLLDGLKGGLYRLGPNMTQEGGAWVQERFIVLPAFERLIELRNWAARRGGGEHIQFGTFALALVGSSLYGIGCILALSLFPAQIAPAFPALILSTAAWGGWMSYLLVRDTVRGWRCGRARAFLVRLSAELYGR